MKSCPARSKATFEPASRKVSGCLLKKRGDHRTDRQLSVDQHAAAPRQSRQAAGETSSILLAVVDNRVGVEAWSNPGRFGIRRAARRPADPYDAQGVGVRDNSLAQSPLLSRVRPCKGQRISYSGFYKAWKRAVRAAGIARVPHDFRRTAIRNLERDGVPRLVAMAMVGQKTEEVYRRYAIVDEAMIREAAVKMNRGAKAPRAMAPRTADGALLVAESQKPSVNPPTGAATPIRGSSAG